MNGANLPGPIQPGHLCVYLFLEDISPAALRSEPEAGQQPGMRKGHSPPFLVPCPPLMLPGPAAAAGSITQGWDGDVPRGGGTGTVPSWK